MQDPYEIASSTLPVYDDSGTPDEKNFAYRVQALLCLMNPINQKCLRSVLLVFKHIRENHLQHTTASSNHGKGLEYCQLWADLRKWQGTMLRRTYAYALRRVRSRVGRHPSPGNY